MALCHYKGSSQEKRAAAGHLLLSQLGRVRQGVIGIPKKTNYKAKEIFKAIQGEHEGKPRTTVGFLGERLHNIDIGLLQLRPRISFQNEFIQIDARPKKFIPLVAVEP